MYNKQKIKDMHKTDKQSMNTFQEMIYNGLVIEYTTYLDYKYKLYYDKKTLKYIMKWIDTKGNKLDKYNDVKSKNWSKVFTNSKKFRTSIKFENHL